MTIPIEFEVQGRPSSVNNPKKKADWRNSVAKAAKRALRAKKKKAPGGKALAPHAGEVTVKVFFCPHTDEYLDIDNGVKHTLDAISKPPKHVAIPAKEYANILANDKTAMRLIVERFPPKAGVSMMTTLSSASTLLKALNIVALKDDYGTAIKVEKYICNNGNLW